MQYANKVWKLVLVVAFALGAFAMSSPEAGAQTEYKPKVNATTLADAPLIGVAGRKVIIKHFEIPPGYVGGKHFHLGQVFVYVLEGEITLEMEGDAPLTLKPGELFQEPLGRVMRGKNLSADDAVKIVVFQIGEEGKPMMVKVE